ncbi:MAG: RnfABCDGE type electron transport complex subunit D [Proteobacteria bacterium]|jgi:Na+-translocating ferredoxin:NAD+ oxidoreductase subunit D|nr:RnfABCDGE type electron transport complex subunit D [Pseudomonadota bacterium]
MRTPSSPLLVRPGPFLGTSVSTPGIMFDVLLALIPVVLASFLYFGLCALLVIGAATAGAVLTEWLISGRKIAALADWTAILTGILLGLTLPPAIPLWMAFLGGVVAIVMGKAMWGGLGQNLFNPALVGRAFLQASFPTTLTTWAEQGQGWFTVHAANFAVPLMHVDAVTTATPLNKMKFEQESTFIGDMLLGNTPGSLGETSALLLILCGVWLLYRRAFDWRIPVSILVVATALAGVLFLADMATYPTPWFALTSGGLLFGAIFMATDPATSPMSPKGAWIFGGGIAVLVVLIRQFGGLSEGVMYAILLMNAATPLINRVVQPKPFGRGKKS